jgi:hypothetical protein
MEEKNYLKTIIELTKLTSIYGLEKQYKKEISQEGNTIIFLSENSDKNFVKLHLPDIDEEQINKNINCYIDLSKVNTANIDIFKIILNKNYPQIYITKFPENIEYIYYDKIKISKFNINVVIEQLKYFIKEKVLDKVTYNNFLSEEIADTLYSLKENKWDIYKINKEKQQFFINFISFFEIIVNKVSKTDKYPINLNYLKCWYNKDLEEMIKIKNEFLKLQEHSIEF